MCNLTTKLREISRLTFSSSALVLICSLVSPDFDIFALLSGGRKEGPRKTFTCEIMIEQAKQGFSVALLHAYSMCKMGSESAENTA
jgi:hypothetical protein